ncbi:MAG: hypothetical protein ABR878_17960 [Roseiarcus sp.]
MNNETQFRTPEQEVIKLLEECTELRRTLKTISAQLTRIENRVKLAFPASAKRERKRNAVESRSVNPSITSEEALAEFDKITKLVAAGAIEEAEGIVEAKPAEDLLVIARELGVSFAKSKPSVRAMREAIFGKVRESVLLSRHHPRS